MPREKISLRYGLTSDHIIFIAIATTLVIFKVTGGRVCNIATKVAQYDSTKLFFLMKTTVLRIIFMNGNGLSVLTYSLNRYETIIPYLSFQKLYPRLLSLSNGGDPILD